MHTHLEPRQCGMSRRKLQGSTRVCVCVHVWVCVHQRACARNRARRSGDVFLHEAIDLTHPQPSLLSYTHTTPTVHTRSHLHLCTSGRHVTQIRQRFRGKEKINARIRRNNKLQKDVSLAINIGICMIIAMGLLFGIAVYYMRP